MKKEYDVIIIGAGPGGMTAALYASRANLKVLMLDRGVYGGQMNNTADIENYPGFKTIKGPKLAEDMYESSIQFGAEYAYGNVEKVSVTDEGLKIVHTEDYEFVAKAIVIATGAVHKHLGVLGEDEYSGRGVSYCAVCDGAFFKDKKVVVIGGGDSAIEESLYLAQVVGNVTVIHRRDELRAQKWIQDRAFANNKINFVWNTSVSEILGDGMKVTGVKVYNKESNKSSVIDTSGVFIYVGNVAMTEPFKNLGITNEKGWILTDDNMKTGVEGIFAIGDVRNKSLRQITTAVGDGGIAGQRVFEYVDSLKK